MKTQKTEWQSLLDYANEELKKKGYSLRITETEEGFFRCEILHNGVLKDCYGENYFEGELEDLISDAWHSILLEEDRSEPKVYVGRWDLLPEDWEGINGLYEKSREEISEEVRRQNELCIDDNLPDRDYIGVYTLEEFEEEFNGSHSGWLTSDDYWIKFIVAGKPLDL